MIRHAVGGLREQFPEPFFLRERGDFFAGRT
jgi:hypothetical protein